MTLANAMMSALSGLRATQSGISVVANNVANAGSTNYTRKQQTTEVSISGSAATGVKTNEVTRVLDKLIQRQLWTEMASSNYASTQVQYHDRVDQLFGQPGDSSALDGIFNTFTNSLQALATNPDNTTARTEVLNNAQALAQELNGLSSDVQSLRSGAELGLSTAVDEANDALQGIKRVSDQIDKTDSAGAPPADLLDQRDGYISKLAALMDIKVVPGGGNTISVFTSSGGLLFDGEAATLSFDTHGDLSPQSAYDPDPAKRSVGTITLKDSNGGSTDMISAGLIRSGTIGALIELRDKTLPQAQTQLDTVASQMSLALSNRTVSGTAASSGAATGFSVDTAGIQHGNPLTVSYTVGGAAKTVSFVEVSAGTTLPLPKSANGGANGVEVVGYTGGTAGARAAIAAKLGSAFTVGGTGTTVTVLDDGAAGTSDVGSVSASITNTGVTGSGPALPLFLDRGQGGLYTGSFDGNTAQRTGFAARIGVNTAVLGNPSTLVQYASGTEAGDSTRPQAILDALTKTAIQFQPDTGIGGAVSPYSGTVAGFTRAVVETQGRNAETAKNISDGQTVVLNALTDKLQSASGVNVDTEMSNLLQLQNAYSANARVMSTVKDMLQTLLNM